MYNELKSGRLSTGAEPIRRAGVSLPPLPLAFIQVIPQQAKKLQTIRKSRSMRYDV